MIASAEQLRCCPRNVHIGISILFYCCQRGLRCWKRSVKIVVVRTCAKIVAVMLLLIAMVFIQI
jgi:hypothetical protein